MVAVGRVGPKDYRGLSAPWESHLLGELCSCCGAPGAVLVPWRWAKHLELTLHSPTSPRNRAAAIRIDKLGVGG